MTLEPLNNGLSDESNAYLKTRPKSERSPLGQFLTPRILRDILVSKIPFAPGMRVLDPGVGTGEFLKTCSEQCEGLQLFGWDIDTMVLDVAHKVAPSAMLTQRSALSPWTGEKFDVVIGNPPYFEMKALDQETKKDFADVIAGRPNIFSLFFKAGNNILKDGGYLAYVVPPSMNNGAYFEKLRRFIVENFKIEFLQIFDNPFLFEDVQTAVQLIVLKKGHAGSNYTADLGSLSQSDASRIVFSADPNLLTQEFRGRTNLYNLGYKATTGTVVWNTRKDDLSMTEADGAIPLIWASNITSEAEIVLNEKHPKRPQYILNVLPQTGPAIVVNRITGSVGRGSLRCALIPAGMKFVAENHVNVIKIRPDVSQSLNWDELLLRMRSPDIARRIQMLTGNTQISATELTNWIPLDM
jgi:adenine-specific DNA-methyltransferase